jgi:hypothetical protein
MSNIILFLRGHVRNSFKDEWLYNFVNQLSILYNVKVYIHTWDIYANNVSWRNITQNSNAVTRSDILNYFSGIKCTLGDIVIDSDKDIELVGDLSGNIFSTLLPKIAWKRMWYGIYKVIDKIKKYENNDTLIINTRFDLFNNSNPVKDFYELFDFVEKNINKPICKNMFLRDSKNLVGIDNFYIGNSETMYFIANNFHNNMDNISKQYGKIFFQEATVYYENNRLFIKDDPDKNNYNDIEKYYKNDNIHQKYENTISLNDGGFQSSEGSSAVFKVENPTGSLTEVDETYGEGRRPKPYDTKYIGLAIQPSVAPLPPQLTNHFEPTNLSEQKTLQNLQNISVKKLFVKHTANNWGNYGKK